MFYIGLFLIYGGLLPLSEFVDDLFFYMGDPYLADMLRYSMDQIYTALILLVPGIILTIAGWNRPHKKRKFLKGIGIFLMVIGVLFFFDDDLDFNSFYYATFLGHLLVSCSFFIPGLLMFLRNNSKAKERKEEKPPQKTIIEDLKPVQPTPKTPIDLTIEILRYVENAPTTQSEPDFLSEVKTTIDLLKEIKNEEFEIDDDFLGHISSLSKLYLEIEDNKIQTEKSRKTLTQIEETFNTINEALENIYDRNFNKKADLIEEEILTLKTKLNLKGELDTPFEKSKIKKS